jgi:hypothetical protein
VPDAWTDEAIARFRTIFEGAVQYARELVHKPRERVTTRRANLIVTVANLEKRLNTIIQAFPASISEAA